MMTEFDKELEKMARENIMCIEREFRKAVKPYIKILCDIKARYPEPVIIPREDWESKNG
jgi:hypothetical protein